MTACTGPRELMLQANREELEGVGDSEVAVHVRSCARCRVEAARILGATTLLDRALSSPGRGPDVDRILQLRHAARPSLRPRGSWRRSWATLAAAAVVVSLALWGRRETTLPGTPLIVAQGDFPVVDAPSGQNVAVIETDNPEITVLWFY